ncbi:hypothetical protein [Pseudoteredinibacter isoporae]|uniref:Pilin n=1 Tax=Pseudoteredinibacter isoporae TaxID=570281 RepID=A0A7X0JV04_9GAMM|nr:hypothetical protein [Pseudoteredinibacter isoporae]MBB6521920.1 hypothetical protein [Pseudoteredinibacter isoporae]NHO87460.1 hypothetical protein [Pseudoteredinibacter isoporae]NIB24209.1 hypothetical protein [Pseudoteredinibacter isoporae]
MNNIPKNLSWSYNQRTLVEFSFFALILGVLIALAAETMPTYIKSAKLVEPINFAKDVQTHMIIDAALTGRWSGEDDIPIDKERWGRAIQEFEVNQFGNISITLHDDLGFKDNNVLGFNLNSQTQGKAFLFYSWQCGNPAPQVSLYMAEPVRTTVPPIISHTICRK